MVVGDELARHVSLLAVVPGTKGDVMHRSTSHACHRKVDGLADINDAAIAAMRTIAYAIAFACLFPKPQQARQNGSSLRGGLQHKGYPVKTADRLLCRNSATAPDRLTFGSGNADEREVHAIRVGKLKNGLAEASA